jgi:rare lipoprotein A
MLAVCTKRKPQAPASSASPLKTTEVGIASWYGHPYHGRYAANGEIYDMEKLTAAHRTLPFGTWVRVRNTVNGKTVEVRINDRGPFIDGRIIDLSRAAAEEIDLIRPGIVKVRLDVIARPASAEAELYAVQVGAFRHETNARRLREGMQSTYGDARIVRRDGLQPTWRVLVGRESSHDGASALAQRIRKEHSQVFVVRLDEPAREARRD